MMIDDNFERSFWGGVVGDMYGSCYEFKQACQIPLLTSFDFIQKNNPVNVFGHKFGGVTDDTILMILAMQSFIDNKGFDEYSQAMAMGDYIERGMYCPNGVCFDIGNATMLSYSYWKDQGLYIPEENVGGNGILMKLAPYALWSIYQVEEKDKLAYYKRVVDVSHGSIAYQSVYSMGMMLESKFKGEKVDPENFRTDSDNRTPTGFCEGSWNIALDLYSNYYEEAITEVIQLGGDTDTNACILGQLIGYNGASKNLVAYKYKFTHTIREFLHVARTNK